MSQKISNNHEEKIYKNFNKNKSFLNLSEKFRSIESNLRAMQPITGLKYLYKGKLICVWEILKINKNINEKAGTIKGLDHEGNLLVTCKDYYCKITKVLSFGKILTFSNLKL